MNMDHVEKFDSMHQSQGKSNDSNNNHTKWIPMSVANANKILSFNSLISESNHSEASDMSDVAPTATNASDNQQILAGTFPAPILPSVEYEDRIRRYFGTTGAPVLDPLIKTKLVEPQVKQETPQSHPVIPSSTSDFLFTEHAKNNKTNSAKLAAMMTEEELAKILGDTKSKEILNLLYDDISVAASHSQVQIDQQTADAVSQQGQQSETQHDQPAQQDQQEQQLQQEQPAQQELSAQQEQPAQQQEEQSQEQSAQQEQPAQQQEQLATENQCQQNSDSVIAEVKVTETVELQLTDNAAESNITVDTTSSIETTTSNITESQNKTETKIEDSTTNQSNINYSSVATPAVTANKRSVVDEIIELSNALLSAADRPADLDLELDLDEPVNTVDTIPTVVPVTNENAQTTTNDNATNMTSSLSTMLQETSQSTPALNLSIENKNLSTENLAVVTTAVSLSSTTTESTSSDAALSVPPPLLQHVINTPTSTVIVTTEDHPPATSTSLGELSLQLDQLQQQTQQPNQQQNEVNTSTSPSVSPKSSPKHARHQSQPPNLNRVPSRIPKLNNNKKMSPKVTEQEVPISPRRDHLSRIAAPTRIPSPRVQAQSHTNEQSQEHNQSQLQAQLQPQPNEQNPSSSFLQISPQQISSTQHNQQQQSSPINVSPRQRSTQQHRRNGSVVSVTSRHS